MKLTDDQLEYVFERTSGYCHLCHRKLAFCNYALIGERGAWEVEHSIPRARGGTNRLNNLYAAHIRCNRSKGARPTRSVRRQNGYTCAPLSVQARRVESFENMIAGGGLGMFVGAMAGPPGLILGGLIGASFGYDQKPYRW